MLTLNLGNITMSYAHDGVTTSQVAGWLEAKYHVMEIWFQQNEKNIVNQLSEALADVLDNQLMGAPPTNDPYAAACSWIENGFKSALSAKFMDGLGYPGVPTLASLGRRSPRFKAGFSKMSAVVRPSFIDTGLYQASFKAWVVSS